MQLKYSNELKVGAAIVIAVLAAFAGVRFFQDVPLFGSSYMMEAKFDSAGGLVAGNPVRMKGVRVGSVEDVTLDPETQTVRVRFQLSEGVRVPEESTAQVSGISAFGGVYLKINPGPETNDPLASGAVLEPPSEGTLFDRVTEKAPALADKADSTLTNANATMKQLSQELQNPTSDLRRTLVSLREMSGSLEEITEAEKDNIRQLLQNLEGVTSDLKTFTGENGDSLDMAVHRLNRSMNRLNRSLASFEQTSATLDTITTKLNKGKGTAGRLINDPSLYNKMDSAATRTNRLLKDFQQDPGRYLDDMTLVKVF